jgi:hypothetical protein
MAGNALIDRQNILDFLNTLPNDVAIWRASTGAIFLSSNSTAKEIAEKVHEKFPGLHFIISPIQIGNMWGWTDKGTWEFIRTGQHQSND